MDKKRVVVIFMVAVTALVLIFVLTQGRNIGKVVFNLPDGFVLLDEAIDSSESIFSYVFWESQISLLDADGICIYQTSVRNDDFIVKYKEEYYVSEIKLAECIMEIENRALSP